MKTQTRTVSLAALLLAATTAPAQLVDGFLDGDTILTALNPLKSSVSSTKSANVLGGSRYVGVELARGLLGTATASLTPSFPNVGGNVVSFNKLGGDARFILDYGRARPLGVPGVSGVDFGASDALSIFVVAGWPDRHRHLGEWRRPCGRGQARLGQPLHRRFRPVLSFRPS